MDSFQPYHQRSRQCELCIRLIERTRKRCEAYPDRIPPELWNDEIEHSRPHPGDNGLLFEVNVLKDMKQRRLSRR